MSDSAPIDPELTPDYTALLTHAVHTSEALLLKFNTFYPFGAVVTTTGHVENHSVHDGDERPPIRVIISLLADTFAAGIAAGRWRAAAVCMNVRCPNPENTGETDAVRVNLSHRCGSEMIFFIPYSRTATGYAFERPFKA